MLPEASADPTTAPAIASRIVVSVDKGSVPATYGQFRRTVFGVIPMHRYPTDGGNSGTASKSGGDEGATEAPDTPSADTDPAEDGRSDRDETEGSIPADEDPPERRPDTNGLYSSDADGGRGTGPATTIERSDKGLASTIGYENRDARGRVLSSEQRAQANRLRRWDRRFRHRSSRGRNLETGLNEVKRMATALGLKKSIRKIASQLFRQATERGLLHGRSIESIASAAVYAAARTVGYPRSYDEVATVSRVDRSRIVNGSKVIQDELDLGIEPVDPGSFLPRICSEAGVSPEVRRTAERIVRVAQKHDGQETSIIGGASPTTIAASAVFAAVRIHGGDTTQSEIAEVANVHVGSIRGHYRDLLDAYDRYGPPGR